jgi:type IV pilus assembly protein PilZ
LSAQPAALCNALSGGPRYVAFDLRAAAHLRSPRLDTQDRRTGARAPIELRVEYKRLNSFFADYTKNISRGGTFICTDRPLGIGTDFVFNLGVPNLAEPLVLKGKVQWIVTPEDAGEDREPGMGIGFVFESEVERERIEATVEKLMIESLGPVLYNKLVGHRRGER